MHRLRRDGYPSPRPPKPAPVTSPHAPPYVWPRLRLGSPPDHAPTHVNDPKPEWLVPGALVTFEPRGHDPHQSGPYAKGTFNRPGQVYVVVELVHDRTGPIPTRRYGGGIGACIQTTGPNQRRYAGSGKWVGYGHLRPVRVRVDTGAGCLSCGGEDAWQGRLRVST